YAMYHGPDGLTHIAQRVQPLTDILARGLAQHGMQPRNQCWFDTLTFACAADQVAAIHARATQAGIHLRRDSATQFGLSLDECTTRAEVELLWQVLLGESAKTLSVQTLDAEVAKAKPNVPERKSTFLQHPHFTRYHSETAMLRYMKRLEDRDIALNR